MIDLQRFKKINFYIAAVISAAIYLKFTLANYGHPFLFHPDEPYIYKDSFRILNAITELDFSIIINPYNLLLSIWYCIIYPLGIAINLWNNFEDFKLQILAESFSIIYAGRLFSFFISTVASIILFNYFADGKKTTDKIIIALFIFFNPIEWISNLWIKFDPFCYLINVVVLIMLMKYKENKISYQKISILLGFAFATRMDFASYFVGFIILSQLNIFPVISLKKKIWFFILFIGSYLIFTNTLFHTILTKVFNHTPVIETEEGFVSIFISNLRSMSVAHIFENIKNNAIYYIALHIIICLPLIIYDVLILKAKVLTNKMYISLQIMLWCLLLIYGYHAPHYWLISQICYLFFILLNYRAPVKMNKIIVFTACIYFISLTGQIYYFVNFKKDTRVAAAEYIFQNSQQNSLIAIEGYQDIGAVPPISECKDDLINKSNYIQKNKIGTGLTFEAKSKFVSEKLCRPIIEIDDINRFGNSDESKKFVIDYDSLEFANKKPLFFIARNYTEKSFCDTLPFNIYIAKHHKIKKQFKASFIDPRMLFFVEEKFFPKFIIYSFKWE